MIIKNDSTLLIMIMNIIIIMNLNNSDEPDSLENGWVNIEQNPVPLEDGWVNIKENSIEVVSVEENDTTSIDNLFLVNSNDNFIQDMIPDTLNKFPIDDSLEDPLKDQFEKARRQRVAKILMEEHSSTNCKNFFGGFDGNCVKPGCGAKSDCHPAIHTFKPIRTGGLICWCGKLEHLHPSKKH